MKLRTLIATLVVAFCYISLSAQVNVYHASEKTPATGDGAFYALPQTVLKVDVIVKATEQLKGPYSDYAEGFLGLEEVNKFDFTTWNIEKLEVTPQVEPDPGQLYFVEMAGTDSKDLRKLNLKLNEAGILVEAGDLEMVQNIKSGKATEVVVFDNPSDGQEFPEFYTSKHVETRIDTIIRRVTVDTAMEEQLFYRQRLEDKSTEEMAVAALQKIEQIRESKYKLITGFQETAYAPGSIEFMHNRLDKLEKEYLDLFRGKSFTEFYHHTFYVVAQPKNGRFSTTLFHFAPGTGITDSKSGEPVQIEVSGISADQSATTANNTGIAYRVPATATVKVFNEDEDLFESRMEISQFGEIKRLPAKRFRAEFDPETGGLKSLYIERGER
jgi:hypothetical protein